ncbi:protein-disulfide reductase DsbD family protein [Chitinophagales bacterium]|nr:protein-disulfide reductase DsbD family protein [Chitinophagales bacterium]
MKTYLLSLLTLSTILLFSCQSASTEDAEVDESTEVLEKEPIIQILEPVKWVYTAEQLEENQYKITFNATIEDGWYVYSSSVDEDGPIPTSIYFDENESLGALSDMVESGEETKDGYDEMFDMNIKKFGHAASFSQVFNIKGAATITGYLEFMTCDSMQCLFPDPIEFTVNAN